MGLGNTVKNMLGNETNAEHEARLGKTTSNDTPSRLPAGTGPGTSGKTDSGTVNPSTKHNSESAMEQELEHAQFGSIEGYGTDAASALGGSLSGSHQASGPPSSGFKHNPSKRSPLARDPLASDQGSTSTKVPSVPETEARRSAVLPGDHLIGHSRTNAKDSMPTANAEEDTNQLLPITHERVRHLETEEVARVKDHERHIHHIQHHTQPVIASEELAEQIHEQVIPVTVIKERHTNKPEDATLFEGQVRQHHDSLSHGAKERTVIDKGTVINEHVHHHVHHIIQPVIEKETIERHIIHTTVPIHEITHEAPVVHQSQTHAPVPLEHFLSRGGSLLGAISQDEISAKVLQSGRCAREVEGVAEKMEQELHLAKSDLHTHNKIEVEEMNHPVVTPVKN